MEFNESFLKGSISKALIKFAIPLMLANILQMLYSMVDLFIVGHFASAADLSAVATASMVTSALTMTITGFSTSVTVLVGQFAGSKEPKRISSTIGTGSVIFLIAAIIITLPLVIYVKPLVGLLNAPAEAVIQTQNYLAICCSGLIFIFGYNLIVGALRGLGNSKAPFLFVVVSSVINIIVDYILVKVFRMGATGAAIATVGSQAVSFFFALFYVKIKKSFQFKASDFKPERELVGKILKIGCPIALQEFLVNLSFVFIMAIINVMGVNPSAASGVVEKIIVFFVMPITAFSAAVSAMSANNIGAKQPERAEKCMWVAIGICFIIELLLACLCIFKGDKLVGIFAEDKDVIKSGYEYLRSYCFDPVFLSFVFIMNGYFNSCGHSVFTMAHSLITTFCVRLPLVIIFSKMANVTLFHIGISAPVSSIASILICLIFLFIQRKKRQSAPAEQ